MASAKSQFPLGTDHLGRDLLFRTLLAARLTLFISGLAACVSAVFGTTAGLLAGYLRGTVDAVIVQAVDLFLAFPTLLLVLALVASVGRSVVGVIVVLGISGWAEYTRIIRGAVITISERAFIEGARAQGAGTLRILVRHILPNIVSYMVILTTLNIAQFIITESTISFLGLGPSPPDVTWGGMIGEGRDYIFEAWWDAVVPGVAICLTVLALNYIGDAMREAMDPFAVLKRRNL
jgi:peptide/nickel transport system permease protein